MLILQITLLSTCLLAAYGQHQGPTTTPVPILKQINRQNDDGSYSFGYEAADGSFKIETKYPNGDVAGKYGYVDEAGKLREISYGASSKRGFEPQGAGIMVPPPTLNDERSPNALTDGQEDDGQYREDPSIYEDPKYNSRTQKSKSAPIQSFRQFHHASPTPAPQNFQPQYQQQTARPAPIYQQQQSLFDQSPQRFPQDFRSQSSIFHQQPQFSFQQQQQLPIYQQQQPIYQQQQPIYQQQQPIYQQQQPIYQQQQPTYQQQSYRQPQQAYQNYNPHQNFNPFTGHPAQNFDPSTGSYTINFTG